MNQARPQFFTLIMMMSFASVNAVLFTPGLPDIAHFFSISDEVAQYTVSLFLIGYAIGQLIYGPLAKRFGAKNALYMGIGLQIVASIFCALSGVFNNYLTLMISRFLVALGSGVGLKMTFTLVNESAEPKEASQKIAYLMLTFAITPGLGVALGGFLNNHFGWMSCFIAGACYGIALLFFIARLPSTKMKIDKKALQWNQLKAAYGAQLNNSSLIAGALLMGGSTCFVYVFAALAPFIAINAMMMSSTDYGLANIIPSIGLVIGSLASAHCAKRYPLTSIIKSGVTICVVGAILMTIAMVFSLSCFISLFLPMVIINMGISFILANASTLAMSNVEDKAHGSALMSFINMGVATIVVLFLGYFTLSPMLLALVYLCLALGMLPIYYWLVKQLSENLMTVS